MEVVERLHKNIITSFYVIITIQPLDIWKQMPSISWKKSRHKTVIYSASIYGKNHARLSVSEFAARINECVSSIFFGSKKSKMGTTTWSVRHTQKMMFFKSFPNQALPGLPNSLKVVFEKRSVGAFMSSVDANLTYTMVLIVSARS
uniref:AlNc14C540G12103 protein n=1 Tax=Albugo laibachii Nc14 TaxID=890382 RepID=F0X116_9STRA|nr:AlNc14C540G12103 [Albugo laibachii Nc14]|eukprot:CCA27464.1 AlNc14C540G12103 [Albugo laibachii Nc14]